MTEEPSLSTLIGRMRERFEGFNEPAADAEVERLVRQPGGSLPASVLDLYRDHDGSDSFPEGEAGFMPARLMPLAEQADTQRSLDAALTDYPTLGRIAWLWTDDNSNYAGILTDGVAAGWLVKLAHDDANLAPAWRSVGSFYAAMLASSPGIASADDEACDVVMIPREVPVLEDCPEHLDADRRLARRFRESHAVTTDDDDDLRRLYAASAIALTPVADTADVLPFLREPDMWTPEFAIHLLELREYRGPLDEVERLARDGKSNGDAAALRMLVRTRTDASRAALARLESQLTGRKLNALRAEVAHAGRLLPPNRY